MSVLEVNNVSIRYITGDLKEIGLKEYVTRKLTHNYHLTEFWADRDITFTLEKGEMLGIIGTNGAGKSTLLKAVSGIMRPTKGNIKREGSIAALLELGSGFDGDLTVRENTYLRGAMLGYTRQFMNESYDSIIDFAELQDFQDRPFKQLSSGMKSRLAFSIACLVRPDILILDEVLSVGDGAFKRKSEAKMKEIIRGGATTILVSHSIEQVKELCDKVLWLDKGEQIAFGDQVYEICDLYEQYLKEPTHIHRPKDVNSSLLGVHKEAVEKISRVASAFSENAINSTVFRKNALVSHYDAAGNRTQFCAFYDADAHVAVARRLNGGPWEVNHTEYIGAVSNVSKSIAVAIDGGGRVHLAWSGQDGALNYIVSSDVCGLQFEKREMLKDREDSVAVPEFYLQPSGDLLLLYLYRRSKYMSVVLNRYSTNDRRWSRVSDALIVGENGVSAYWQACVDSLGRMHISWCWRNSPDLRSNHDLCYLASDDDTCQSFHNSDGSPANLPVTEQNADVILKKPEGSMLINQTSMTVDERNIPFITAVFRQKKVVQYFVLFLKNDQWKCVDTKIRKSDVSISDKGAVILPMARPQIVVWKGSTYLLLRDAERGSKASVARLRIRNDRVEKSEISDITTESMGVWEPTYDPGLWNREHKLEVFMQREGSIKTENDHPEEKWEDWIHVVRVKMSE